MVAKSPANLQWIFYDILLLVPAGRGNRTPLATAFNYFSKAVRVTNGKLFEQSSVTGDLENRLLRVNSGDGSVKIVQAGDVED